MAEAPKRGLPTRRGFESDLERFFGSRLPSLFDLTDVAGQNAAPSVDVVDREDELVVRAELPGFSKDSIDVSVDHNSVTIKAESREESTEEEDNYIRREMSRGYVSRTVALPTDVASDKATAKLADGVLEITVPKAAASTRQKISVD